MRILVTGSRNWTDRDVIYRDLDALWDLASGRFILMHGWCPTGADAIADSWGQLRHGVLVERYAAKWSDPCRDECRPNHRRFRSDPAELGLTTYCPAAGNYRNQEMVDRRPDQVRAYQLNGSRGTQDCIDRSRAAGLPVVLDERA